MPQEANHLVVRGGADEGHVAVSEGAIDLQVEARLGCWVSVLPEGLHSISRQVKVEAVCTDLRCRHLKPEKAQKMSHCIKLFLTKYISLKNVINVVHYIILLKTILHFASIVFVKKRPRGSPSLSARLMSLE